MTRNPKFDPGLGTTSDIGWVIDGWREICSLLEEDELAEHNREQIAVLLMGVLMLDVVIGRLDDIRGELNDIKFGTGEEK